MVREEWLEELRTNVSGLNPTTIVYHKNSVELELEQLLGTIKLELVGGASRTETNFFVIFGSFLGILKIKITTGW